LPSEIAAVQRPSLRCQILPLRIGRLFASAIAAPLAQCKPSIQVCFGSWTCHPSLVRQSCGRSVEPLAKPMITPQDLGKAAAEAS